MAKRVITPDDIEWWKARCEYLETRIDDVKFALKDQHFGSYSSLYRGVWCAVNDKDWDWPKS